MTSFKNILKIEFKDAIRYFSKDNTKHHIYRINRLMSNGSLIDFEFYFLPHENPNIVIQEIDLNEFGKLTFHIDVNKSVGKLVTHNYKEIINNLLDNYEVNSESNYK